MKQEVTVDITKKKWLNLDEAIAYIGFGSPATFLKWRNEGILSFVRIGGTVLYRRTDIDRMLEEHIIHANQNFLNHEKRSDQKTADS